MTDIQETEISSADCVGSDISLVERLHSEDIVAMDHAQLFDYVAEQYDKCTRYSSQIHESGKTFEIISDCYGIHPEQHRKLLIVFGKLECGYLLRVRTMDPVKRSVPDESVQDKGFVKGFFKICDSNGLLNIKVIPSGNEELSHRAQNLYERMDEQTPVEHNPELIQDKTYVYGLRR